MSMPGPTSSIFSESISLTATEPQHFDAAFLGTTQPCPWPKAYGGDLVAQAATAAMRTVEDGKELHSMHSYFMRPVDIGAEVRYEVEILRDGRGYSTRQVRAFNNGKAVYLCLASFTSGGVSGSYQSEFPDIVAQPDDLPSAAEYLASRTGGSMTAESKAYWSGGRSFDMRHVPGPVYLSIEGEHVPHQAIWVRAFDEIRPVQGLSERRRDLAALAYVCDYTILEPVLRVLGLPWAREDLVTASLDHAMWFHRPGPVDGWLLYAQQAVSAGNGRGVAVGRFFDANRTHLATVVQEGLIRTLPTELIAKDKG